MKKIFAINLFLLATSLLYSQTHTDQNGLHTSVTGSLSASGTQARQFEIAKVGYNSHHWQNSGIIIIELFEKRYASGYEKYIVQIGYAEGTGTTSPKVILAESRGITHLARVRLGTPSNSGSDLGGYPNLVIPIYVDVRHYSQYKAKITHIRNKVDQITSYDQIQIITAPTPVNISDFSVSTIVENNLYSSGNLRITGNGPHYISNGSVGIGTTDTRGFELAVKGNIGAEEIQVKTSYWSDFVFEEDYDLKDLEEVETFIKKNKHLPNIPSEKEVLKNGVELGKMDAKLLQKIEELTLYMIEQNKQTKKLIEKVENLEQENKLLKQKVEAIEAN